MPLICINSIMLKYEFLIGGMLASVYNWNRSDELQMNKYSCFAVCLAAVVVIEMVVDLQKLLLKRLAKVLYRCVCTDDVFLSSLVATTSSIECMLSSSRLHTSAFPFSKDALTFTPQKYIGEYNHTHTLTQYVHTNGYNRRLHSQILDIVYVVSTSKRDISY